MPRSTRPAQPRSNVVELPVPRKPTWRQHLAAALRLGHRRRDGQILSLDSRRLPSEGRANPFEPARPLPGVVPSDRSQKPPQIAMDMAEAFKLAMDQDPGFEMPGWLGGHAGDYFASAYEEGQVWLGYSVLALLSQRVEYRTATEIFATEMTREWIKLKSKSEEAKKKKLRNAHEPDLAIQAKIDELDERLDELRMRYVFRDAIRNDGYQGRGQVYVDTDEEDDDDELKTSIGSGDDVTREKWGRDGKGAARDMAYDLDPDPDPNESGPDRPKSKRKKKIKRLAAIEPMWCYPGYYDATNPLRVDWYNPETWWVMGKEVHKTRLLTWCSNPVADILKPAYSFGGLSRTQMMKPYVDFFLRNRTSGSDLLNNFSVPVLSTDLSVADMDEGSELFQRVQTFNVLRDNQNTMVINKDSEEFNIAAAPLAGVKDLIAQAAEHLCGVIRVPIVKFWGDQPSGLNASSEGVIRMFYDEVVAQKESNLRETVETVVRLVQIELWGEVDDDIEVEFPPLWQLDEAGKSAIQKTKADTRAVDIEAGIIVSEEGRLAAARDPDSQYQGLDLHEPLPEPDPMELMGMGEGGEVPGAEGGEVPTGGPAAERGQVKGAPGFKPSRRDMGSRITGTAGSFGSPATGGFGQDEPPELTASDFDYREPV